MDKVALLNAIVAALAAEFAMQNEAAEDAHKEATNDESRAEDRYDMRGQLAAYLAAGQAKLADEVATAINAFRNLTVRAFSPDEPAAVGAVVRLEARGAQSVYFLGPAHGGLEVQVNGDEIMVVTPSSPLGRSLMGRKTGERVALPQGARTVEHTITAVQ
ncbi:MAG TPA: transcription elongation factor [Opitutaceae bacterium]|nr:transcription elongation factor [Opitutaceae bacterium]